MILNIIFYKKLFGFRDRGVDLSLLLNGTYFLSNFLESSFHYLSHLSSKKLIIL